MTSPDFAHLNSVRFSLISCVTEDSIESAAIATPLDASPPPPPSTTFSIINVVNDDPLPNLRAYPAIAATYTTRRRRAQTSPRPVPSSIIMNHPIPLQQPITVYDNDNDNNDINPNNEPKNNFTALPHDNSSKPSKFWPRIKRMMSSSSTTSNTDKMKQLFESMNISTNQDENSMNKVDTVSHKPQEKKSNSKRWMGRNRARVGPQR
ncbi:unnamed protein product [Mucor hiemalis]